MLKKLIATLALVGLAATGAAQAQEKSRLDEILARGKLIVGVSSEAPPFGFIDDKGELVGFDIDIAKLLAKQLFNGDDSPKRIEFVKQGFAARWPNVESGAVDIGIQVTTILPDRVLRVAFTRPYIDSGIVMVVRKDSSFKRLKDLDDAKYTTALLTNPQQAERAKKFFPKAKTQIFDSIAAQFTAVKSNRADGAQLDTPVAQWYVKQNPDMRILEEPLVPPTNNAVFMKMGDFKMWLAIDTLIGEMTGGSLFNDYSAIYEKWFGTQPNHTKYYFKR
ncbi:MAG TPA: transporter substrate-binding domain-containing protein [Casimicrobiaceae bacterium]|nr:transporter substrate-binding domain-containing protein [Casimicrobiaceae bacterium]